MLTLPRLLRQCLATFVVVGLLAAPTAFVAWTAYRLNQPEYLRAVENQLGLQLGIPVHLAAVRYPKPGIVEYRGLVVDVEAADSVASNASELLRAELLRIERHGSLLSLQADGLRLKAPSPRLAMAQIGSLLQRAASASTPEVALSASTCEVFLGPGLTYSLQDLAASFQKVDDQPQLVASCRIGQSASAPRCEFTLERQSHPDQPLLLLTLNAAEGQTLPAAVLDPFFDSQAWLGARARVQGILALQQAGAADWSANFQGSLLDVDLAALIAHVAPDQTLQGLANLDIEHATWADQPGRGSGWVEASGRLHAPTPGAIGSELLSALQSQLHFELSSQFDPQVPQHQFSAFGLGFNMLSDGTLHLQGALGPDYSPEAVLVAGHRFTPLLSSPRRASTVAGLVRTLVPGPQDRPDLVIPARFESLMIQRVLPAPAALALPDRATTRTQ